MKISKYTLRYIALGKEKKTYLRYFVTVNGKGETYNIPCDVILSAEQLQQLNNGTLGGMIQKELYRIRDEKRQTIERFALANNTYPTAQQLRIWNKLVFSNFKIEYWIRKYLQNLHIKPSSIRVYAYAISKFKTFYKNNLGHLNIEEIISKNTISMFGDNLKIMGKFNGKNNTFVHIHNYQSIVIRFLNYVAENSNLPKIEFFLRQPSHSSKWHIDYNDYNRLLQHKPKTKTETVVLDIIKINSKIGLRINELLNIEKDNITVADDCVYIKFLEHKKSKERTVVVVDAEAMNLIKKYMNINETYIFPFQHHNWFNTVLRSIAKEVFKNETVKIYKNTIKVNGYVDVYKYKAISSHSFRRYAIERNIAEYGVDVARTFSGHQDTQVLYKHYADFMHSEDLKKRLLKK
ncbi:MAG: tyrosine-type recombinase/integrase [Bacteroidales bacterium]|nr:tyrosine-type recombinase/integrase [Bacteroidales bacterium]